MTYQFWAAAVCGTIALVLGVSLYFIGYCRGRRAGEDVGYDDGYDNGYSDALQAVRDDKIKGG